MRKEFESAELQKLTSEAYSTVTKPKVVKQKKKHNKRPEDLPPKDNSVTTFDNQVAEKIAELEVGEKASVN